MKKPIILFLILFSSLLHSEEVDLSTAAPQEIALPALELQGAQKISRSTFYVNVGTSFLPIPIAGVGYRHQKERLGIDLSLNSAIIIVPLVFQGKAMMLYYPNPNPSGQWYFGGGGAFTQEMPYLRWTRSGKHYFSPSLTWGKEFTTDGGGKRYFQGNLDWFLDTKRPFHYSIFAPFVSIGYGFGF